MFNPDEKGEVTTEVQRQLGTPGRAMTLTDAPDVESTQALDVAWQHWLDCTTSLQALGFSAESMCEATHDIERIVGQKRTEFAGRIERGATAHGATS